MHHIAVIKISNKLDFSDILPLPNILKNESKIANYTNRTDVPEEGLKSADCTQLD